MSLITDKRVRINDVLILMADRRVAVTVTNAVGPWQMRVMRRSARNDM